MCNSKFLLNTNDPSPANEKMDINIAAVSGIMAIGSGFFNLEELLASMDIPGMTHHIYTPKLTM